MYDIKTQNEIIELRKSGYGVSKIANILSIDRGAVSLFLRKKGIDTCRNPIKKDIFDIIDTEEKAYWLGFLYADGSLNPLNGQVSLGLQEKDKKHLEKYKEFLKCNNVISYKKNTKSYSLNFACKRIYQSLIEKGCVPRKSLILTFPTNKQVPAHLKKHFMRGYVDGDGCLCCTDKTYCFSFVGTKSFINEAISFFNWKPCKLDTAGQAYVWRCADKKKVPYYLDYLYKDAKIYLDRKFINYQKMSLPYIKEI